MKGTIMKDTTMKPFLTLLATLLLAPLAALHAADALKQKPNKKKPFLPIAGIGLLVLGICVLAKGNAMAGIVA